MEVSATLRYLRMSPRKVRLVVDLVRGMDVNRAEHHLQLSRKWAAKPVLKLLRSAIANAEHNNKLERSGLFIKKITADLGPTLKRYRPRAFGSAAPIRKRMTHINIVLSDRAGEAKQKPEEKPAETTGGKKVVGKSVAKKSDKPVKRPKAPRSKPSTKS